ncbi:hypothetical protein Pnap_0158 [Polaromonas naphthalenivorans CJ2]|uniref:Uncharacterized protein n=1 Tax=Polaromonas naphthalenivorans (strain CJ2) TaxID=365044 RepID=A1VIK5_POLNA|nr:hypothetical protein Pnap_0158 [Polaromonas naphthalenivorans CJ2]
MFQSAGKTPVFDCDAIRFPVVQKLINIFLFMNKQEFLLCAVFFFSLHGSNFLVHITVADAAVCAGLLRSIIIYCADSTTP